MCPWSQALHGTSTCGPSAVPWGWWPRPHSRAALLCAQDPSWCCIPGTQPAMLPSAGLHLPARSHREGGWQPGLGHRALSAALFLGFPHFSPCSTSGCVRAVMAAQASAGQGLWPLTSGSREIVMCSAHLLFQNRGGLSAPCAIGMWYLLGFYWGKQHL